MGLFRFSTALIVIGVVYVVGSLTELSGASLAPMRGLLETTTGGAPDWMYDLGVPENPEQIDLGSALDRTNESGLHHVSLPIELDHDRRVHPTGLHEPPYTTFCRRDEAIEITGEDVDPESLDEVLGCNVYLEPQGEVGWVVTVKDGQKDEARNVFEIHTLSVFTAFPDYGPHVWLVSPNVVSDPAGEEGFPQREFYEGLLTRREDLRGNHTTLSRQVDELEKTLREEVGRDLPDETYFVLVDTDRLGTPDRFAYVPVLESEDRLFVRVSATEELEAAAVSGILERSDARLARELGEALGTSLPQHVAILTPGSPQDYPRTDVNPPGFRVLFGAVLLLVGVGWAFVSRSRGRPQPRPGGTVGPY
jgi:hypothetical protein